MKKLLIQTFLLIHTALFARAQPVAVKFRIISHELFIPVRLTLAQGDTLNFMFDSGAGTTLLDSAAAVRLHLSATSGQEVTGAGGNARMKVVNDLSLAIGSIRLDSLTVVVCDLSKASAIMTILQPECQCG